MAIDTSRSLYTTHGIMVQRRPHARWIEPVLTAWSRMKHVIRGLEMHQAEAELESQSDHQLHCGRAAGRSFFSAMRLLPVQRRRAMRALNAFCRELDDIADGAPSRSLKQILLANWRSEIALLFAGHPQHDVTRELSEAVHLYDLRCDDFLAIIDGMAARTDIRAPSFAELDRYCEHMAVAISRISVRIFGEASPAGQQVAAELGRALQLTNILRDLAEDACLHRLYLPRELLHAHGIFATMPSWVLAQPALPDVCRDLALIAKRHYAAAGAAIAACPRGTMRPAAVLLAMNRALLHELLACGWRRLDEPVRIPPGTNWPSWFVTGWRAVEDPPASMITASAKRARSQS